MMHPLAANQGVSRGLSGLVIACAVVQFAIAAQIYDKWRGDTRAYVRGNELLDPAILAGVMTAMAGIIVATRREHSLSILATATALQTYTFGWACKHIDAWRPHLPAKVRALVAFCFITFFFTWLLFFPVFAATGETKSKDDEKRAAAPAGTTQVV
eukprot:jgi/Mesvir1/16335/Mv18084-RA.1